MSYELRGAPNVRMWVPEWEVESSALNQIREISRLPWVEGVRIMPDVHYGKGATVGSVIAMKDAVAPSAVGVDIGCGMMGVKTNLTVDDLPESLLALRLAIEAAVPVGFHAHDTPVNPGRIPSITGYDKSARYTLDTQRFWDKFGSLHADVAEREQKARCQLGTLGGGNHFIELCSDENDVIWLQLHSGSRNIGKEIAERHIATAKTLEHNLGLPDRDMAVFLASTAEMTAYLNDLNWAQGYAARSRQIMMQLVCDVVRDFFPKHGVEFEIAANVHHNYVAVENVDGQDLIVTRKGAIRAGAGDIGLIPGSMGTGSYIIRGLGNPESYWSASHGAGRRMSRGAAKRAYTTDDVERQTLGVECRKDAGVIDEIPSAYKNLSDVIAAQSDLVEVITKLDTLLCVKG